MAITLTIRLEVKQMWNLCSHQYDEGKIWSRAICEQVSLNKLFSEWTENGNAQEGEKKKCRKEKVETKKQEQGQGIWRRKKYGK